MVRGRQCPKLAVRSIVLGVVLVLPEKEMIGEKAQSCLLSPIIFECSTRHGLLLSHLNNLDFHSKSSPAFSLTKLHTMKCLITEDPERRRPTKLVHSVQTKNLRHRADTDNNKPGNLAY